MDSVLAVEFVWLWLFTARTRVIAQVCRGRRQFQGAFLSGRQEARVQAGNDDVQLSEDRVQLRNRFLQSREGRVQGRNER